MHSFFVIAVLLTSCYAYNNTICKDIVTKTGIESAYEAIKNETTPLQNNSLWWGDNFAPTGELMREKYCAAANATIKLFEEDLKVLLCMQSTVDVINKYKDYYDVAISKCKLRDYIKELNCGKLAEFERCHTKEMFVIWNSLVNNEREEILACEKCKESVKYEKCASEANLCNALKQRISTALKTMLKIPCDICDSDPDRVPTTPAPTTPREALTTPAPTTPREAPTTPAPTTPREAPTTPAPTTPREAPTTPAPTTPREDPTTPAPITPREGTYGPKYPGKFERLKAKQIYLIIGVAMASLVVMVVTCFIVHRMKVSRARTIQLKQYQTAKQSDLTHREQPADLSSANKKNVEDPKKTSKRDPSSVHGVISQEPKVEIAKGAVQQKKNDHPNPEIAKGAVQQNKDDHLNLEIAKNAVQQKKNDPSKRKIAKGAMQQKKNKHPNIGIAKGAVQQKKNDHLNASSKKPRTNDGDGS